MTNGVPRRLAAVSEFPKTIAQALALALPIIAILPAASLVPGFQALLRAENYFTLPLLEAVSIALAVLVFGTGWQAVREEQSGPTVLLASAFLAVALLDFAHFVSFPGMPGLVTPSSQEKTFDFWLAARLASASAIFVVAATPRRWSVATVGRWAYLAGALAYAAVAGGAILFAADALPQTFVAGRGPAGAGLALEQGPVLLNLASAGLLVARLRVAGRADAGAASGPGATLWTPALFAAALILAAGAFAWSLSKDPRDAYSLIAHLDKIVAYSLVYRLVFADTVLRPYARRVESERRYRELTDQAADAILRMTPDGRVAAVNPMAVELTGRGPEELNGLSFADLMPDGERASLAGRLDALLRTESVIWETELVRHDGARTPVEINGRRLEDGGLQAIVRDISRRKQVEGALRQEEERFRLVALATRDAIYDVDLRTKRVWRNDAYQRLYSPEGPVGVDMAWWEERVHPEDRARVLEEADGAFRSRSPFWSQEYRFRRADGRYATVIDRGHIVYDAAGAPVRVIGAITDITEHKRAEQALRRSEERFRDFAETASDWFWETGPDHRFSFVSKRLSAFGVDTAAILGKHRWDLAADREEEPDKWRTHLEALDRHEPFRDFVYRIWGAGHAIRFVSVSGKPVFDAEGRFAGYRGGARDVTEAMRSARTLLEAKEQAEVANRAKSAFLANMSHELRTPLNAIIGFSEMMESGLLGTAGVDRYRSYATHIHASGMYLLDIINDILDVSRIEAGRFEFNERSLQLSDTMVDVMKMMAGQFEQAGLVLALEIAPDLPRVRADERAIRQILLNLISNALKFTESGGTVTLGLSRHPSGDVRLWVADTGVGIAAEDIPKLMRPFTQLGSVYMRKRRGTGLGLMLVRSLTELHGGTVEIESAPGKGTTIMVRLPAARIVATEPEPPSLAAC